MIRLHLKEGRTYKSIAAEYGVSKSQVVSTAEAMPDGFSADLDEIRADQLTREMAEAFVEKVIVWLGQKLEIQWKFKKESGCLGASRFFQFKTRQRGSFVLECLM